MHFLINVEGITVEVLSKHGKSSLLPRPTPHPAAPHPCPQQGPARSLPPSLSQGGEEAQPGYLSTRLLIPDLLTPSSSNLSNKLPVGGEVSECLEGAW